MYEILEKILENPLVTTIIGALLGGVVTLFVGYKSEKKKIKQEMKLKVLEMISPYHKIWSKYLVELNTELELNILDDIKYRKYLVLIKKGYTMQDSIISQYSLIIPNLVGKTKKMDDVWTKCYNCSKEDDRGGLLKELEILLINYNAMIQNECLGWLIEKEEYKAYNTIEES